MKQALSDDILPSGHLIKKGWIIEWNQYSISRYEPYWGSNANEFIPERWLPQMSSESESVLPKTNKPPWIPFQYGPRVCLGLRMATAILEGVLFILVHNFSFFPSKIEPHHSTAITLRSSNGIFLYVKKR